MAAMTSRAINLYKIKYTTFPKGESAKVFNGTQVPMRGASQQNRYIKNYIKVVEKKTIHKDINDQAALTQHHVFYLLMTAEVASLISLVVPWGLLVITFTCKLKDFFF